MGPLSLANRAQDTEVKGLRHSLLQISEADAKAFAKGDGM